MTTRGLSPEKLLEKLSYQW